ncbi:hypothetical protein ABEP00_19780 [Heyndrickxia sporothermodurans]|uniref:hypothetical protein n=1 Tax=Heyndrickxia sporothermodurans TaxID=46224 RepID=UPI003D2562A3
MLQGDTVRLKCHFKTFDGKSVDPVDVKLTIYNSKKEQIEQIPLSDTNKENVGVYFYDYVPASELNGSYFYFEFAGSIQDKPILSRGKVEIKFN